MLLFYFPSTNFTCSRLGFDTGILCPAPIKSIPPSSLSQLFKIGIHQMTLMCPDKTMRRSIWAGRQINWFLCKNREGLTRNKSANNFFMCLIFLKPAILNLFKKC